MPFALDLSTSKDILDCIIISTDDIFFTKLESMVNQHQQLKLVANFVHTAETLIQAQVSEKTNVLFFDSELLSMKNFVILHRLLTYVDFFVLLAPNSFVPARELEKIIDQLLVKPCTPSQFQWMVGNLFKSLVRNEKLENDGFIFVKGAHRFNFDLVKIDQIIYVEADKNDIIIHTDAEKFKVRFTIGDLERQLDNDRFVRVSRSYLVALSKITKVRGNQLILKSEIAIFLSGKYKLDFYHRIEKLVLRKFRR